jgi:hypothetical protein
MPNPRRDGITMRTLSAVALLGVMACETPAPIEEQPRCQTSVVRQWGASSPPDEVDLLLVIDDSASMSGEQAELGAEVARVLRSLPWLGQLDTSLHVAVVSSDLGAGGGGSLSEGCSYPLGRDGRMLRAHTGGDPGCAAVSEALPYLTVEAGDNLDDIADRVGCLVHTGAGGCGFEQPLEAALKALTPAASELRFQQERGGVIESDTAGHGSGANAGFLRESSLLVIAIITDEDDCSTADMDLFSPSGRDPQYPSSVMGPSADPAVQCAAHPSALHPVQRYVDGFLALRPGMEDFLVFVVVGGVDPELLSNHSEVTLINGFEYLETDYATLLAEPGMQEVVEPSGAALVPACTRAAPDEPDNPAMERAAAPPRRLIAVAEGLRNGAAASALISVCSAVDPEAGDHRLDLGRLEPLSGDLYVLRYEHFARGLPRPMARDANHLVQCRVTETLREGLRCEGVPGRTFVGVDEQREVCELAQLGVPPGERVQGATIDGAGWYYDDFNAWIDYSGEQGVQFTSSGEPRAGSKYYVECVEQVCEAE